MAQRLLLAIAAGLASLATASWPDPPLSGNDFGFSADFKNTGDGKSSQGTDELKFSTKHRPAAGDVIKANSAMYDPATIALLDPDAEARQARYIAFLEISYIPGSDSADNVMYSYPWIRSNMTVQDSGELLPNSSSDNPKSSKPWIPSSEVRNATIQVWRQTGNLDSYINNVRNKLKMSFGFALSEVFTNSTSDLPYDFKLSSIDFKVQNKTGTARCDVNDNGAPIPSVSRGATDCLATATVSGKGSSTKGASASSTSKKNDATDLFHASAYSWIALAVAASFIL